jgi:uncharacterized cupin superfamily protein
MILEPSTVVSAREIAVPLEKVPTDQVVAGTPSAGSVTLDTFGETEVGVWEMTPGAMSDVEAEEIFIVLAGAARVDFTETGQSIDLEPGSVGRFREGSATVWTVTETLRKVYLA